METAESALGERRLRKRPELTGRARQEADYALGTPAYQQSDVLGYIVSAELAIRQLEQAAVDARRGFVAHVLFRQRTP